MIKKGTLTIAIFMLSVFFATAAWAESYIGIGIVIAKGKKGHIVVEQVISNGPAAKAGVNAGEFLMAVDSVQVTGKKLDDVTKMITKGEAGSLVSLTLGDATDHERTVTVARQLLVDPCILNGAYYLTTNSFNSSTPATYVQGSIGSQYVYWPIMGMTVYANVRGRTYYLNYMQTGGQEEIYGWIGSTLIQWFGFNGSFSGYQSCVQ